MPDDWWGIYGVQLMEPMEPLRGRVVYVGQDRRIGFQVERPRQLLARYGEEGRASVSIELLELFVARRTGQFLYLEGYCAKEGWHHGKVSPPAAEERGVRFQAYGLEEPYISHELIPAGAWATTYDRTTGWLRIAEPGAESERAALFADGCIAGITRRRLVGLWLKPTIVKTFDQAAKLTTHG